MLFPVLRNANDWLDNAFDDFFDNSWMPRMNATAPAVNVKETDKAYEMEVAAPGLKKEFCRVGLDDEGNLEVKLENKLEHKEENKKEHYLRREFNYSNFEQRYTLPDDIDREAISAKVEDGVLHVTLPRKAQEQKTVKRIEVA